MQEARDPHIPVVALHSSSSSSIQSSPYKHTLLSTVISLCFSHARYGWISICSCRLFTCLDLE